VKTTQFQRLPIRQLQNIPPTERQIHAANNAPKSTRLRRPNALASLRSIAGKPPDREGWSANAAIHSILQDR